MQGYETELFTRHLHHSASEGVAAESAMLPIISLLFHLHFSAFPFHIRHTKTVVAPTGRAVQDV